MDVKQVAKQMIDFQKATFNNTFTTLTMLQDQGERVVNTFLEQAPMFPSEAKEAFQNWIKLCKKARDDYKKAIDESYSTLEKFFSNGGTSKK